MSGRGAWSANGVGGTLSYPDGSRPGSYYTNASGDMKKVGSGGANSADPNERAVHGAVLAYQRALRRRSFPIRLYLRRDGIFGPQTAKAVSSFQKKVGIDPWGGIGPDTSKLILMPDLESSLRNLKAASPARFEQVTTTIICGLITQESAWDAGAVGYVDPSDVGLGQINAQAHPEWDELERLQPLTSFNFIAEYLAYSLKSDGIATIDDAIASYNLGIAGARRWISQNRPQWYVPSGQIEGRDVHAYINKIKTACA